MERQPGLGRDGRALNRTRRGLWPQVSFVIAAAQISFSSLLLKITDLCQTWERVCV